MKERTTLFSLNPKLYIVSLETLFTQFWGLSRGLLQSLSCTRYGKLPYLTKSVQSHWINSYRYWIDSIVNPFILALNRFNYESIHFLVKSIQQLLSTELPHFHPCFLLYIQITSCFIPVLFSCQNMLKTPKNSQYIKDRVISAFIIKNWDLGI